ncbi:hypothetical protein PoB_001780000 [Plakobranchus ocellatus]|uniref:CCHC-type domain-containing protein n=1 Tax=Plakobranchus ocellatus TaxID=259542 RepID=A0AAV3Z713_9GAST|nr:hypothetical protein PoB_001780000 [Plakobranchus ocellatus]
MKRYDLTEDGYRRKFRSCKPAEGESPDMFIVRIVTYLDRWIELSRTDKSYEKPKDLIVREQFMDACPEDLATSLRERDLPTLERVAKEADLFLRARNGKLCDQSRKLFQSNARPRMDSVRPLEPEKRFNGGQRAGEAKTSVADQRSCFKCKKTGHIARYCTAVDSTTKKAGAGVLVYTTEVNTAEARKPAESPTMKVTDDLQSEVEGGMLKLVSGKSVPVMTNCAALRDLEKTRSLGLLVLKGVIGGREVDVMRDTGCEGVVVRKQLVDASQLTGECCLLLRIDNTALLAEKAVISLRTPFLSGEVKALCILDAICDVIVGNVEGARSPEDPMSVMVSAATTRVQAKREAVTKPLRVPDKDGHVGVDREQLIKLQQEDPRIQALTCLRRLCSGTGTQSLLFAYREVLQESTHFAPFELLYGRTVRGPMHIVRELWTKEIEEPEVKSSYEYVLNLCERLDDTLKIACEELEKAQGRQKHYYERTAKRRKFSVGEKVLVLLPTDSNKLLMQWNGPFEIVTTVGINDYRINMGEKEIPFMPTC